METQKISTLPLGFKPSAMDLAMRAQARKRIGENLTELGKLITHTHRAARAQVAQLRQRAELQSDPNISTDYQALAHEMMTRAHDITKHKRMLWIIGRRMEVNLPTPAFSSELQARVAAAATDFKALQGSHETWELTQQISKVFREIADLWEHECAADTAPPRVGRA